LILIAARDPRDAARKRFFTIDDGAAIEITPSRAVRGLPVGVYARSGDGLRPALVDDLDNSEDDSAQ
jgi:hypothetical protein